MNVDSWLAFVLAYTVISLIPGPSVMMVISQSLSNGRKAAFYCIAGDLLGGVALIALSLLGVGALLAASALAFEVLKWLGVGYLAYLGLAQLFTAGKALPNSSAKSSFWAGFLTGVLNPKAILFYMAFLSQFMDPSRGLATQFSILVPTASVVVATVLGGYALLATQAASVLKSAHARRRAGYASGGFLLAGSAMLAARG